MESKVKIVALLGASSILLGAFGAHGLKPYVNVLQLETYKTATLYHLVHLMPLLIIALNTKNENKVLNISFYLFLSGIILFSGSLYLLSVGHLLGNGNFSLLGPVTPIGGVVITLAWLNLLRYKDV